MCAKIQFGICDSNTYTTHIFPVLFLFEQYERRLSKRKSGSNVLWEVTLVDIIHRKREILWIKSSSDQIF